jgi:hypothetical protein
MRGDLRGPQAAASLRGRLCGNVRGSAMLARRGKPPAAAEPPDSREAAAVSDTPKDTKGGLAAAGGHRPHPRASSRETPDLLQGSAGSYEHAEEPHLPPHASAAAARSRSKGAKARPSPLRANTQGKQEIHTALCLATDIAMLTG